MDLSKIQAAAERVAKSLGLEVVEVEWKVGKGRFLRVFIDRPPRIPENSGLPAFAPGSTREGGAATEESATPNATDAAETAPAGVVAQGISHRDCEAVSHQLSVILDVEELIPGGHYTLEVSSPGLDRKLIKRSDYERFAGRKAKISLAAPVENSKYFEGRLVGLSGENVQMEVKGRVVALPIASIRKASLMVEF